MSLTLPKTCSMGASKTGLVGTVGVTLLNPDGTVKTARATAGVYEIGGGSYGKQITFDDNWSGVISWDTGGGTPVYAVEEYNIEGLVDAIPTVTEFNARSLPSADMALNSTVAKEATLETVAGYLDTEIAAILADTNELQTDWVNGGRLDLILDIIAADTTTDIPALIAALKAVTDLIEDILRNKLSVIEATGAATLYADDNTTPLLTNSITSAAGTTTRTRLV